MTRFVRLTILACVLVLASCSQHMQVQRQHVLTTRAQMRAPDVAERHALSYLVIAPQGPAEGQAQAYFRALDATQVSVAFLSHIRSRITVEAQCDGPARARPAGHLPAEPAWRRAGLPVRLVLAPRERNRTWLDLSPQVTECQLTITPGGQPSYALTLSREDVARPEIAAIDRSAPICAPGTSRDPLARAFLSGQGLSMTCPRALGASALLLDGSEAFNARVEALTGRRLSAEQLAARDPDVALDYSNAPQLDMIYMNYLNLNADFAGYVMARMLAWHAARGTIVRILVSGVMLTNTDRALFEGLAAQYPSVQIQPFRFPASAAHGVEDEFARLHRVSHVKLFATLSPQPGRSRALIGGRNIHEGYFFDEPGDLSAHPYLLQYDPEQTRLTGAFSVYHDFEIALTSDAAVRDVVAQMGLLWHRDQYSHAALPPQNSRPAVAAHEGQMRHFLSVPYADDRAQVQFFVDLIDAAQDTIRIAMPYLNLPEPIALAFERAHARGVSVELVTTLHVREWSGAITTAFNQQFVNRFGGWMGIYDYTPGNDRMLHAKIIVIDDRLSLVTSTNLNARSFEHDLENGLVILDRQIAAGLNRVIDHFVQRSQGTTPDQEISGFMRFLTGLGPVQRGF